MTPSLQAGNGSAPSAVPKHIRRTILIGAFAAAFLIRSAPCVAQNVYTWDASGAASTSATVADGSGVWSTSNPNWFLPANGHDLAWPASDTLDIATFGSSVGGAGSVSVAGSISANGIVFNGLDLGGYTVAGLNNSSLVIYGGGVSVQSGAGNESFASTIRISVAANQTWANNSVTSTLAVYGNIDSAATGSQTLTFNGPGNTTIDGAIENVSGTIELTQAGTGTTTLAGNNTFGNATTGSVINITAGTLSISADSNLGADPASPQPAAITLNGGTLAVSSTFTLSQNRGISVGASGGTIRAGSGDTLTYAGPISGSGGLTAQGAGAVVLSGASSYNGPTSVHGGTLTLSGANPSGGPLTVANESTVNLNYATSNTAKMAVGALTLGGTVNLVPNPVGTNQTLSSGINLLANSGSQISAVAGTSASNFVLATGSGSINRAPGSTINFNVGQNANFSVATGAAGNLQNDPTGIIGGWATVNGTAWASVDSTGNIVPFSGSTYVQNTWAPGTNTFVSDGDDVPANSTTNSLVIGGDSSVYLTGTNTIADGGILIANNGSGFSGQLESPTHPGSCALTSGNGSDLIVQDYYTLAPFLFTAAIVNNGSTSIGFTKSGPGTVELDVGTSVTNTYTGPTVVSGGTLELYGALPGPSPLTIATGATVEVLGGNSTFGSLAGSGSIIGYPGSQVTLTVGGNNSNTAFSGSITENSQYPYPQIVVIKTGSGTWTVSGQNDYSQGTDIIGGTLQLSGTGTLGSTSGPLGVGGPTGTATLDLNGVNLAVGLLSGYAGGLIVNSASGTTATLTIGNGNPTGYLYSGVIADHSTGTGVVALIKTGTGAQFLNGANTYTGGTTITGGSLTVAAGGSLAAGSPLTFNNLATFAFQGSATGGSQSLGQLTVAGGDDTIQSMAGSGGSTTLAFSSSTRDPGAMATFLVSGGANGASNKITIASAIANSFLDAGTFASTGSGDNYAWNDAAGFIR